MRFYTTPHPVYCGIDLHARPMYLCLLNQDGEMLFHRNMPPGPAPFLQAVAPSRTALVVCVAGLLPWSWLADLCAREGMPLVLGHALSRKAIHGGNAKNDTMDAQTIAGLLRGAMLPQAYVSPAAMRATRARRRRRLPRTRKRAALVTHGQQTTSQSHLPEIGNKIAYKAQRSGVAARFADPAVPKSVEGDLALRDYDDPLRRDLELARVKTAKPHDAPTLYLLQTVPGIGKMLSLVRVEEIHDIARCPRGQACVSYGRVVQCAQEAAGTRHGTSGTTIGHAYLQWAFSEAALLLLRNNPAGQKSLARLEKKHGKGKALTVLAPQLARAVYYRLPRRGVVALDTLLQSSGRGAGEPAAYLGHAGRSLATVRSYEPPRASLNAPAHIRRFALPLGGCLDACSRSCS